MVMEFVGDLFVAASLALLLSFLVAKLVSFAIAGDPSSHTGTTKSAREPSILPERLTVQCAQNETKVRFPSPIQVVKNVEIEHHIGEIAVEPLVVELPVESNVVSELSNVDALTEDTVEEKETGEFGLQAVGSANLGESVEQRNTECIEEISMDRSTEMGISAEAVVDSGVKERDVTLGFVEEEEEEEEEDWEAIERSELEQVFMAATEFVVGNGCGNEDDRLASIGSDMQMGLYGLQKVATEGPCREPQPMPFKLSARAKWNAWQKLGNMSPEVAMEQYITLLSDKVPGWMKDNSAGKSEQDPAGSEVFEYAAPDLSTSLSHQQIVVTERELEQESGAQDRNPLIESDLVNNVKK